MDYNFTINNKEDFEKAQTEIVNDLISQITNAEVTVNVNSINTGRIVSCQNSCNTFETVIITVYFDATDETKNYVLTAAINTGRMLFVDESVKALYDEFVEVNENIKHQLFAATMEARRREKEALKKAEREAKQKEKKKEKSKAETEK